MKNVLLGVIEAQMKLRCWVIKNCLTLCFNNECATVEETIDRP